MIPYLPPSLFSPSSTRTPSLQSSLSHPAYHPYATTSNPDAQTQLHSSTGIGVVSPSVSSGYYIEQYRPSSLPRYATPPPHTRPLYATIPLPEVEVQDTVPASYYMTALNSSSSSGTGPTPSPPIQLHPVLQSAYLSPRQILSDAYTPVPNSPLTPNWTSFHYESATWPSVGSLTILVHSTGNIISVRPSGLQSPFVVTVEDILRGLGNAFIIAAECVCQMSSSWPCECDRLSAFTNSLQLWWPVNERAPENHRLWQVVVGRR